MIRRLTKRYLVKSLDGLRVSTPLRYERYYINDFLWIQKKGDCYQKEELNEANDVINKVLITEEEFNILKTKAYKKIIRDSYLFLDDERISIKIYYGDYKGLNRVEINFKTEEEMALFTPLLWMGKDITLSQLAFDKDLSKLSKREFQKLLCDISLH